VGIGCEVVDSGLVPVVCPRERGEEDQGLR